MDLARIVRAHAWLVLVAACSGSKTTPKMVHEDARAGSAHSIDAGLHIDPTGNGLKNFRERMAAAGGSAQVISAPGKGTRLIFTTALS